MLVETPAAKEEGRTVKTMNMRMMIKNGVVGVLRCNESRKVMITVEDRGGKLFWGHWFQK